MKSAIDFLSDTDLVQTLKAVVQTERETTADIVRHLHEIDKRKLYV